MINEQWGLVAIIGFWGWVFCSFGLILKGFPHQGLFVSSAAKRWGGGILAFFAIWFLGMLNA